MEKIRKRIERLEKAGSVRRRVFRKLAIRAFETLSYDSVEPLISAFGAERMGRGLSETESAARRAYDQAVQQVWQAARMRSPVGVEPSDYIRHAILRAVGRRVTLERLELVAEAIRRGSECSAAESEAAAVYAAEWKQLCGLAGFESVEEFEAFCSGEEGGDR